MGNRTTAKGQQRDSIPSRQISIILRNTEPSISAETDSPAMIRKSPLEGPLSKVFQDLDQMIGLTSVKELVHEIYALIQVGKYREEAGLTNSGQVYHMVFKGNPGTGKTTIARLIARLFQVMGVLSKGHFIEVERADLVGEYIGHTAVKTREMIKKAQGGVLFIDEAYSLARGGEKDFGKEAIDALVKGMEDHKDKFVLILAGYSDEMDNFMETNPGLPSRFPIQMDFPDYTVDELMQISELMAKEREYVLVPQTCQKLRLHLTEEKNNCWRPFSNARYVRNVLEKAVRHQAVRLLNQYVTVPSRQELMTLRPEDLKFDYENGK